MTTSVIVARRAHARSGSSRARSPACAPSISGAIAIRAALARAGVAPEQVEYTIMGHVLQAGPGSDHRPAGRVAAGIPNESPAITINKVCLSGTSAIAMADQMIRAGELEVVVAGGMESMTNAPFVLPKARDGARLGDAPMLDSMIHDGLWCAFDDRHMGEGTDAINAELGIAREDQDAWAARSHARAHDAWEEGRLAEEVVPSRSRSAGATPVVVDRDEGIRPRRRRDARRPAPGVRRRRHGHGRATRRRSPTAPPRSW